MADFFVSRGPVYADRAEVPLQNGSIRLQFVV
jgi:hypothetical protein